MSLHEKVICMDKDCGHPAYRHYNSTGHCRGDENGGCMCIYFKDPRADNYRDAFLEKIKKQKEEAKDIPIDDNF